MPKDSGELDQPKQDDKIFGFSPWVLKSAVRFALAATFATAAVGLLHYPLVTWDLENAIERTVKTSAIPHLTKTDKCIISGHAKAGYSILTTKPDSFSPFRREVKEEAALREIFSTHQLVATDADHEAIVAVCRKDNGPLQYLDTAIDPSRPGLFRHIH